MKLLVILSVLFVFLLIPIQDSFSELELSTNSKVYSPEHTLQVYGIGLPGENLILRLFAPDESITKFEQIQTDPDGSFNYQLLTWPIPSSGIPYGTYVVEVLSTEQNGLSKKINIKFSSTTELISVAIERNIDTVVFAPETGALNQSFRVFSRHYTPVFTILILHLDNKELIFFKSLFLMKVLHPKVLQLLMY
jgi:hypothetical protein